jgi:MFS family permease
MSAPLPMSFRSFIYWCALGGGCGAYVGWVLGRLAVVGDHVGRAGLQGMLLGMMVALLVGLVDALWSTSSRQAVPVAGRVLVAVAVGVLGGFLGGFVGQALYFKWQHAAALLFGWTLTGLLIGAAPGTYDLLARLMSSEDLRGARRKIVNGLAGGSAGGLLGGVLFVLLQQAWSALLRGREEDFWSPGATGFVALGLCIGLLIGLAQVILKEAWIKVEAGFRPGRELLLSKPEVTLGRAETCDVGLFGDPGVERVHARIRREGDHFVLCDEGSATGTFVNDERLRGPRVLRCGDAIRLGRCVLRFGERGKVGTA